MADVQSELKASQVHWVNFRNNNFTPHTVTQFYNLYRASQEVRVVISSLWNTGKINTFISFLLELNFPSIKSELTDFIDIEEITRSILRSRNMKGYKEILGMRIKNYAGEMNDNHGKIENIQTKLLKLFCLHQITFFPFTNFFMHFGYDPDKKNKQNLKEAPYRSVLKYFFDLYKLRIWLETYPIKNNDIREIVNFYVHFSGKEEDPEEGKKEYLHRKISSFLLTFRNLTSTQSLTAVFRIIHKNPYLQLYYELKKIDFSSLYISGLKQRILPDNPAHIEELIREFQERLTREEVPGIQMNDFSGFSEDSALNYEELGLTSFSKQIKGLAILKCFIQNHVEIRIQFWLENPLSLGTIDNYKEILERLNHINYLSARELRNIQEFIDDFSPMGTSGTLFRNLKQEVVSQPTDQIVSDYNKFTLKINEKINLLISNAISFLNHLQDSYKKILFIIAQKSTREGGKSSGSERGQSGEVYPIQDSFQSIKRVLLLLEIVQFFEK